MKFLERYINYDKVTGRKITHCGVTLGIMGLEFLMGYVFQLCGMTEIHIFTIYELGILATAFLTGSYFCSISGVLGLFIFNYFFSAPHFSFRSNNMGYPLTAVILIISAIMMAKLEKTNQNHRKNRAVVGARRQVLLETSQQLLKAETKQDIVEVVADCMVRISGGSVIICLNEKDGLGEPQIFLREGAEGLSFEIDDVEMDAIHNALYEKNIEWKTANARIGSKGIYIPIRTADRCYGVIGFDLANGGLLPKSVGIFLGTSALAFEREYFSGIRAEQTIQMKNEKLRADLLRSISHDLRTPLTGISGNAALITKKSESLSMEQVRELGKNIWKESMWLNSMVENLLSITKLDDMQTNIKMNPESIDEILCFSIQKVKELHQIQNITYESSGKVDIVLCNSQLIAQVMQNLLENAIKHTEPGTKISVAVESLKDKVVIRVSDDGKGIPDDEKEVIFKMFYTMDSRLESGRGFGIGLPLCKTIIEAHGGEIRVRDGKPHGAVFEFELKKVRL